MKVKKTSLRQAGIDQADSLNSDQWPYTRDLGLRQDDQRMQPRAQVHSESQEKSVTLAPTQSSLSLLAGSASVTLDESGGLQNAQTSAGTAQDADDNDIGWAALPSAFATRLSSLWGGHTPINAALSGYNGSNSGENIVSIQNSWGGAVTTSFSDAAGHALDGDASGLKTTAGVDLFLWTDSTDSNIVLARKGVWVTDHYAADPAGDIVFAGYLEQTGTPVSGARMWTVQYESLFNPDAANPDDPVDLTNHLWVSVSQGREFSLQGIPSGQNLFLMIGDSQAAVVITGEKPANQSQGYKVTDGDTVNTSQVNGGSIATNNQLISPPSGKLPGEGMYFTFVTGANPSYTAPNLDETEADVEANIAFSGLYLQSAASFRISQITPGTSATLKVSAYNTALETGTGFVDGLGDSDDVRVNVTNVQVYTVVGSTHVTVTDPDLHILDNGDGTWTVQGVKANYVIAYETVVGHSRLLVQNIGSTESKYNASFDIGGFGFTESQTQTQEIGSHVRFEDDAPTVDPSLTAVSALTVDDSDFTTNDSASFASLFSVNFHNDGFKDSDHNGVQDTDALTYALGISEADVDSGLVDTLTGQAVLLNKVGDVVIGSAAGQEVLRITVNAQTGLVTLDQSRAVMHDDPLDPDEAGASAAHFASADLITLSATATDGDLDTDTSTRSIGDAFQFKDDGPSVNPSLTAAPTLTVDDSDFATNDSATFANLFSADFHNDGFKDSNDDDVQDTDAITYALGVSGVDANSGLVDTLTGDAVLLNMDGNDVVGTAGALEVFRISVNAQTGLVTLDQSRAVVHDDTTDPEESGASAAMLASAGLITLSATATDGDLDTDTATRNIGDAFQFKDDGPSVNPSLTAAPTLTVDDSDFATNDSATFANLFSADFHNDGFKDSNDDDVQDTDAITYALGVSGVDANSGLVDTLTGDAVLLNMDGNDVVGTVGALEVFRITVNAQTGLVTLDQSRAVMHDDSLDPDEAGASAAYFASADLVTLSATATDGDLDTDTATRNIGDAFQFKDDGPSVNPSLTAAPTLTVDDSDFATNDSATFANLFSADFHNDGFKDSNDDDVQDTDAITYALGVSGVDANSGLVDTLTGDAVLLNMDGNDVVGTVGALEVFRITVNAQTGLVTLDQSRAVMHDDPLDPDEAGASAAHFASADLITLSATATDGDLDTDTSTRSIGDAFQFKDDGPSVTPSAAAVSALTVDDSDFDANDSASFASLFTVNFHNDGFKDTDHNGVQDTDALTYSLGVSGPDADSGLVDTLTGQAVLLNKVGDVVIGSAAGQEVLRITVNAQTGEVTLDQSRAVMHDDPLNPDEAGASAAHFASAGLVTLSATATDGDLDTNTLTREIGDAFQFKDDGPSLTPSAAAASALTVDDSDFDTNDSASFANLFTTQFRNDGFKDSDRNGVQDADALTYALGISEADVDSGLVDTLTGQAVLLNKVGDVVIGSAAGHEVFRITVNAQTGLVTLDQSRAVVHDDPSDPEEAGTSAARLASADLVTLTATATDGDLDTDTATRNIGDTFRFKDDGPSVDPSLTAVSALTVDDSDFDANASASFASLFTVNFHNDGFKDSDHNDVQDTDALTYSLAVSAPNADSGLLDTLTGLNVLLSMDGDDVVGTAGVLEVFRITVNAQTGEITLDQSRSVVHDDSTDSDEAGSSAAMLTSADLVTLTATATDGDLDTDTATRNIGDAFQFKDDGPSVDPSLTAVSALTVDDSDFDANASASFASLFTVNFHNDGFKDSDHNGVQDTDALTYSLGVSAPNADSGLLDTLTGLNVLLSMDGDDVVGTAGGLEVLRITVDAQTGVVTLDQSRAVMHDDPLDPDEAGASAASFVSAGLVTLSAIATDGDLDTDTTTRSIGDAFRFKDDGPTFNYITNLVGFNVQYPLIGFDAITQGNDTAGVFMSSLSGRVDGHDITNAQVTLKEDTADQVFYTFSFDYLPGPNSTVVQTATGIVTVNKAEGTFFFGIDEPIKGETTYSTSAPEATFNYDRLGNKSPEIVVQQYDDHFFGVLTARSAEPPSDTNDLLAGDDHVFTTGEIFNSANEAYLNIATSTVGANSDTMQAGELLNFDFYAVNPVLGTVSPPKDSGASVDPAAQRACASQVNITLDQINVGQEDIAVLLKLYNADTDTSTTRLLLANAASDYVLDPATGYRVVSIGKDDYDSAHYQISGLQVLSSTEEVTGTGYSLSTHEAVTLTAAGRGLADSSDPDVFKIIQIDIKTEQTATFDTDLVFQGQVVDGDLDAKPFSFKVHLEADSNILSAPGSMDALNGTPGADIFEVIQGTSSLDLKDAQYILGYTNNFQTQLDTLKLGLAGDATADTGNYVEAAAAVADYTAALAAANLALAALNGTSSQSQLYAFEYDASNGYLFEDTNSDGAADQVVVLVGIDKDGLSAADIVV